LEDTELQMNVSTKQRQIAELAGKYAGEPITSLHHNLDEPWLREAWRQLSRRSAVGIDGQSVKEYGQHLEANLRSLLDRVKSGSYRAPAVRRVHIPKGDGKETRPIGVRRRRTRCCSERW
jgi:RNA-directed DNA polymerase